MSSREGSKYVGTNKCKTNKNRTTVLHIEHEIRKSSIVRAAEDKQNNIHKKNMRSSQSAPLIVTISTNHDQIISKSIFTAASNINQAGEI